MIYEIIPFTSAGPIKLGMAREVVCSNFKDVPKAFFKDPNDKVETDAFEEEGVFVFYDNDYKCIAIEFAYPSVPRFKGIDLLALSLKEGKSFFQDDKNLYTNNYEYTSYLYGIGAYYERKKLAETVIMFTENYYEM